jgi:hypothetical protein
LLAFVVFLHASSSPFDAARDFTMTARLRRVADVCFSMI